MSSQTMTEAPRSFTRQQFDDVYAKAVAGEQYVEIPAYYRYERNRYYHTLKYLTKLGLPASSEILEIGGGQIAVMCSILFNDASTVGDLDESYAAALQKVGVKFQQCDLLHLREDSVPRYDCIVLCEVIEHLPVPAYVVLRRLRSWLKPHGKLLLTTPNLYRLRNVVRLAMGKRIFDNFHYPKPGRGMGHQLEYSREHLAWQVTQGGFTVDFVDHVQLANHGHTFKAQVGRTLALPLYALPRWRDGLVAAGTRVEDSALSQDLALSSL